MGNIVLMGKNTYESLPTLLDGRTMIVISKTLHEKNTPAFENNTQQPLYFVPDLNAAMLLAETLQGNKVMIIGGAQMYKTALAMPNVVVHLTLVHKKPEHGYDTVIPEFSLKDFTMAGTSMTVTDLDENNFPIPSHTYLTYFSKNHPGFAFDNRTDG